MFAACQDHIHEVIDDYLEFCQQPPDLERLSPEEARGFTCRYCLNPPEFLVRQCG